MTRLPLTDNPRPLGPHDPWLWRRHEVANRTAAHQYAQMPNSMGHAQFAPVGWAPEVTP